MAIRADQKYHGKVGPGSCLVESGTGSLGYQVMLECEDGSTSFTIWLTAKNKERAAKYFECLGIKKEDIQKKSYWDYQMAVDIEGKPVTFGTKAEEYNGKTSIKVSFIGKPSDPNLSRAAANFFGGSNGDIAGGKVQIEDDEIPF